MEIGDDVLVVKSFASVGLTGRVTALFDDGMLNVRLENGNKIFISESDVRKVAYAYIPERAMTHIDAV